MQSPVGDPRWSAYFGRSPVVAGLGLRCIGAGEQAGRLSPVIDRVLDHHGLVIVDRGAGALISDSVEYPITPGTLIQLFPGVRHSYGPNDRGWSERWVLFDGPATVSFRRLGLLDPDHPTSRPSRPQELLAWFSRIRAAAAERSGIGEAVMSVAVQEMILSSEQRRGVPVDDQQLLARARDLAISSPTITDIAAELGVGSAELRRVIRRLTGLTPKAYLSAVRIQLAQSLLTDTDQSIAQVGRVCGYQDPSYFTRVFGQQVGISPTRFRDRYRR